MMSLLSNNAANFIDLFDSRHHGLKTRVHYLQFRYSRLSTLFFFLIGSIIGGAFVFVTMCISIYQFIQKNYVDSLLMFCVAPLFGIAFAIMSTFSCKEYLDQTNLCIRDFRKTVFFLVVELGKLKQRCEDLKGSVEVGQEKENLERLEESIEDLLCQLERLRDIVTLWTVDDVLKEHVTLLYEVEKLKIRLSFYKRTSDRRTKT